MPKQTKKLSVHSTGGVLLTTLVIFFLFLVMMTAAISYINRQYKAVTNQREQQKAFRLAESGIDYTLFSLRQNVATIPALKTAGSTSPTNVNDPATGVTAGTFSLTYANAATVSPESMVVTAKGIPTGNANCETVVATIVHETGAIYTVTSWRHDLGCS